MNSKLRVNRSLYAIRYNSIYQQSSGIPGQLDPNNPTINSDLYLLLNAEIVPGMNAMITGTPANQVPYPGFTGTRAIYSGQDRSIYNHTLINSFMRGFHPGSAFKTLVNNVFTGTGPRTGLRFHRATPFPSSANLIYFPQFKAKLDNFVAGCSINLETPPTSRISPRTKYKITLVGTSISNFSQGWYTYITIQNPSDPTPAYLATADSGKLLDKDIDSKELVLNFVYQNMTFSHKLSNFKYNTWIDLAWSYNNKNILLSINNDVKEYYNYPTLIAPEANTSDLALGPVVPGMYTFMGNIDNLYIKKYV